jgi:hypothetical protein
MQRNKVLLRLQTEIPEHLEYLLGLRETFRHPLWGVVSDNFVAVTGFD